MKRADFEGVTKGTYNIGFAYMDGTTLIHDETQMDPEDKDDLYDLMRDFFKENKIDYNRSLIEYVEDTCETDKEDEEEVAPEEAGTRTLKVMITCQASYKSEIEVPADLTLEEAIKYASENIRDIPVTDLDWLEDSDDLVVEECAFA